MIEINIQGTKNTDLIRAAIVDAMEVTSSAVLPIDRYWSLEQFDGMVGFEFAPDDEWGLVTLHSTDLKVDEIVLRITERLARTLQTACAAFDPTSHDDEVVRIFYADGTQTAGRFQQVGGQVSITPSFDIT